MKHYYINTAIKQFMTSSVRYNNHGCGNVYIGQFESKEKFKAFIETRTFHLVETNDEIIKAAEFQMPSNLPSWGKYSGELDYLIWLFVAQKELQPQLQFMAEQKATS